MLRQAAAFSGGLPEKLFASRARVPFPPCLFSHRVSSAESCAAAAELIEYYCVLLEDTKILILEY